MERIKVIVEDSELDETGKSLQYAIYNVDEDKAVLEMCSFEPNFFEEEMTREEFDVEFAFNLLVLFGKKEK